jgi:hypothetical protein
MVASYDGMGYVHLANLIGSPDFTRSWYYLRTPLFPASLRAAFLLGGEQPFTAMLVTAGFGLGGILLAGSSVRRMAGDVAGGSTLILVSAYPVLVTYQHMLLSETGIFFFLSLTVWLLVRIGLGTRRYPLVWAMALATATALGYYWRPTILYLSPVVAASFILLQYAPVDSLHPYRELLKQFSAVGRSSLVRDALVVGAGPWLLAYPWIHLTNKHPSTDLLEAVTTGMYKQVLVPPNDPMLGELGDRYRSIIKEDTGGKALPLDGLSIVGEGRLAYLKRLSKLYIGTGLLKLIRKHPVRYIGGVCRSFVYLLGVPHHRGDDENWSFSYWVFEVWPAGLDFEHTLGWIPEYSKQFAAQQYTGGAALGRALRGLSVAYIPLLLAGSITTLWWFAVSVQQCDAVPFAISSVPLSFVLLHSLTLMAASRYAFPVYPILLANFIALTALSHQGWKKKRMLDSTRS